MKIATALISGIVLSASVAFAGDETTKKSFNELDTDRNGVLSKSEASIDRTLSAHFNSADVDQDGNLTSREFSNIDTDVEEAE